MIGGYDVILELAIEPELALQLVIETTKRFWRECIIEDAVSRRALPKDMLSDALQGTTEVMVFKDAACREAWKAQGAVPHNANTMVYAIAGDGELTLVVSDPKQGEMKKIVSAIRRSVARQCTGHIARKT